MANFELKENQITIFKNSRKKEGDNLPDYTGKLNYNGVIRDVSLWVKEGKNGKFFSGVHKEEWKKEVSKEQETVNNPDDTLPF